ncbi:MAG: glycoside hydrolase family 3 N-terminal domain-containing protein [Gammaproteobacteria bacterium]
MHLIIDTQTHELQPHEHARLTHPAVCGIILFARHYQSLDQLKKYIDTIKNIRSDLLITIDQEGGRVQRIREPLTRIPPMATLGETYDKNPQKALALATEYGYTISHELKQLGIDINFAPILDLGHPESRVIVILLPSRP